MTDCAICHRHHPTADGDCGDRCHHTDATIGLICDRCHLRILRHLTTIETAWHISAGGAITTGRGGSNERSLPGGTEWLNWRHNGELLGNLRAIAETWHETMNPETNFPNTTIEDLLGWLRRHLFHTGTHHPEIRTTEEELNDWARTARRIAGMSDQGDPVPCPGLAAPCGRILRVNANDWDERITCRGCGTQWTTGRLLANASVEEAWLTAQDIWHWYGIPERTVRHWGKTEQVRRRGNLYNVGDVQNQRRGRAAV